MQIVTNTYPHNWPYILNFVNGPFTDLRVRQAANYAINREDVVELVGGLATPEYAEVPPSLPYYGHPVIYKFDVGQGPQPAERGGVPPLQNYVRRSRLPVPARCSRCR